MLKAQGVIPQSPSPPPPSAGPSTKVEGQGGKGKGVKREREERDDDVIEILSDEEDLGSLQVTCTPLIFFWLLTRLKYRMNSNEFRTGSQGKG